MNLLEMFKQLNEEEKIQFVNLLIDVINDCNANKKPSNEYTIVCKFPHLSKKTATNKGNLNHSYHVKLNTK